MTPQELEAKKKELIHQITGILLDSLEKEEISEQEGQVISKFILSQKDNIIDEKSLDVFLNQLVAESPIFKNYVESRNNTQTVLSQDQVKIEEVKNQLAKLSSTPI
jgi:hypothetical protein